MNNEVILAVGGIGIICIVLGMLVMFANQVDPYKEACYRQIVSNVQAFESTGMADQEKYDILVVSMGCVYEEGMERILWEEIKR